MLHRAWVTALVAVPLAVHAQQQPSSARAGWPCGGRVDPAYFHSAEATGGHLLLIAPGEIAGSADLLVAFDRHPQTLFRLAGSLNSGLHEFKVPIDSSVESVLFSISVQCLGTADVVGPSGTRAAGPQVTDLANFSAERMVIVARPDPGTWTVRVSGSGVAGVIVQAKSAIEIDVQFAPAGQTAFKPVPVPGVENDARISITGEATDVEGSLVDGSFHQIGKLTLANGDTSGVHVARFTPGAAGFRVMVQGRDPRGFPFWRLTAPLLSAWR